MKYKSRIAVISSSIYRKEVFMADIFALDVSMGKATVSGIEETLFKRVFFSTHESGV